MSNFYNPVTACLKKQAGREDAMAVEEQAKDEQKEKPLAGTNAAPTGWVYGIASGVYNAGTGGVKWVASTTYNVGAAVVGTGSVLVHKVARKDKSKNE
ncbi:uncharacterized protein LOC144174797 isoform X1 [Haemaphysalis longicornis]